MNARRLSPNLCETEFRFDRLPPNEVWPCMIWEAGRIAAKILPNQVEPSFKFSALQEFSEFPTMPWQGLPAKTKKGAAIRLVADRADGAESLAFLTNNCSLPGTAVEWRQLLTQNGLVILDLGSKGRHTRPELKAIFDEWLDWQAVQGEKEDWIAKEKQAPLHGRHQPADALRAISWFRITEAFRDNVKGRAGLTVDAASIAVVKTNKAFSSWAGLPTSAAKRSRLKAEAKRWAQLVYEGKQAQ